jgi:hypothetical protein
MDTFSLTFLSFLFKASIVLFVFILIIKTLRRLYINKTIKALIGLPDDRKERLIHLYQRTISGWRILLWLMPLCLLMFLVIPVFLFVFPADLPPPMRDNLRQLFLTSETASVIAYFHILEDFFYKKKILQAIDESVESKVSLT